MFSQENNPEYADEESVENLEDSIDLQALAEEIFRLLKNELMLEDERRGR